MPDLRYRVVDVFAERPLSGNALCVVLDPCPDDLMQPIGREANLSETTFPTVTAPHAYSNRIFTPTSELPFAGHPTLGTAWVLGPGRWLQTTAGASVTVEVDVSSARMIQPPPKLVPVDTGAPAALGLGGAEGCWVAEAAGLRHLLVATAEPLETIVPDLARVAEAGRATDTTTVAVVRRIDDVTLHVRVFVPLAGIAEDPGTGSAAGPIAVLAREQWGTAASVTIRQGAEIGRPSRIEVELGTEGPVVGGPVVACAEGRFIW